MVRGRTIGPCPVLPFWSVHNCVVFCFLLVLRERHSYPTVLSVAVHLERFLYMVR